MAPAGATHGRACQSLDFFAAIDLFEVQRGKSGTHTAISVRIAKVGGKKVKAKSPPPQDDEDMGIPF